MSKHVFVSFLLLLLLHAPYTATAVERVVGYRGDGNGFYADATPPVTGKNIRWKAELPNWCYGTPLIVGQKIFVMSEAGWKSDWPELVCLDLKTGKILWQQPVNHLTVAIPDATKRKQYEAAWHSHLQRWQQAFAHNRSMNAARASGNDAELKKLTEEGIAMGWIKANALAKGKKYWKMQNRPQDREQVIFNAQIGVDPEHKLTTDDLKEYSLRRESFYGMHTARMGEAFPTPASDGKAIYVVTGFGSYASFDLNGKLRWINWIKSGGAKHDDSICRSPIVTDGLMITDNMAEGHPLPAARAFDCETGELKWETPFGEGGGRNAGCGSPKLIELDGERFMIQGTGFIQRVRDGKAYLAPFGKDYLLKSLEFEIGVDDERDLVFIRDCNKPEDTLGIKLHLEGGQITQEVKWRAKAKSGYTLVVHDERIYTKFGWIDINTGECKSWGKKPAISSRWLVSLAGDRLWGATESKGPSGEKAGTFGMCILSNYDPDTGKRLHRFILPEPGFEELPPHLKQRRLATTGGYGMRFSYSSPYTFVDDMILVRSHDHLWCIGN